MTDASRSQSIAAPGPLPLRPLSREVQGGGDAATTVRFTAVLAESTAPVIRHEGGSASPEQMFESNIQNTRDRRKAELRRDHRDAVDRHSAERAQERTGVKARRSQSTQHEPATEALVSTPVKDVATRDSAGVPDVAGGPEPSLKKSSSESQAGTVESAPRLVDPRQGSGRRVAFGERESPPPVASTANTQTRQIGPAPMPFSSAPQAARELARMLASPAAMNGERDTTSVQSVVAGRSDQRSAPETNGAKDAGPSKDPSRSSASPSKLPQSSRITEFERLIRLVRAQSGRQSSTRVLLDPPELGKVHVRVIVEGDRVEVGVETENDSARQLISERAMKLKTALEEHGFVIDRFDVTTNRNGMFEQRFLAGQESPQPRQDQNGSGSGRGFARRPRGASGDVQAALVVENANAGWHNNMGIDIQV